ncbi:MAG: hypothetical protein GXP16_20170 [Gammaproteobacteria bacterium]|nr:hypothetical protein [Gammaproteobacteria bacterium]
MSMEDQLFSACEDGNTQELEKVLKKRKFLVFYAVGVNCKNPDGNTPLFIATKYGQLEAMRLLLHHSADVNLRNQLDMTPLMLAAAMGRSDIVSLLLRNDISLVTGVNPNLKMTSGSTALYLAAEKGDEEIVNMLIEREAEIDAPIEDGSTALYIAAQNGFDQIVKVLLTAGANIDVKLVDNATPIFSAAYRGHAKVVEVLVAQGAATDIVLTNGHTIFDVASTGEIRDIVRQIPPESDTVDEERDPGLVGDSGVFVDSRDDNQYRWVRIGDKMWMADNLRYQAEQYCWPSEDIEDTGYFYGRPVIPEACPEGWRAPEKSDFEELIDHFGGEDDAYGHLNHGGDSGFDAPGAGRRYDDGKISNSGTAYFWALHLDLDGLAWFLKLTDYDEQAVVSETWDESLKINMGASLRCIKQ